MCRVLNFFFTRKFSGHVWASPLFGDGQASGFPQLVPGPHTAHRVLGTSREGRAFATGREERIISIHRQGGLWGPLCQLAGDGCKFHLQQTLVLHSALCGEGTSGLMTIGSSSI